MAEMNGSRKHISISVPDQPDTMSPHIKSADELRVIGFNLSDFSRPMQFVICVVGVFVFYLVYGYMQELIFSLEGFKPFGWYLTLVQFAFYSTFGLIELQFTQDKRKRIPWKTYMLIAFLTVGTMGLSNTSLGYLNYPTQIIFKCCKLIPVMIGGVFIQGKRYNFTDISAALCMSFGLIWFTLADTKVTPNFNFVGFIFLFNRFCVYINGFVLYPWTEPCICLLFSASNADLWICIYAFIDGIFWNFLRTSLDKAFRCTSCCNSNHWKKSNDNVPFISHLFQAFYLSLYMVRSSGPNWNPPEYLQQK
ncbi:adenosine 3'-phospho 5'-phosphosulfate transporter 2 isoform X2 [Amblyraja radiata]|uniref:adenosine 3'-phospho 5'-phosphosulfate transporter 2 isoform X2 n=1 Tax=Amblyraja radiata TaxID=386614 RepID=UPI001403AD19|nr:adenosine 3'-phospho 5'-phosphosulfate transporter 2 isoform X2 [Amblyraja radiata]